MTSRSIWIGALACVVVVALAVGAAVLVTSLRGSSVTLPDRVGGLTARDSAAFYEALDADVDDDVQQKNISDQGAADDYNSEHFSEAFDGADVDTRVYTDADALRFMGVVAIADDAGPLVPEAFDDPSYLKIAFPRVERVTEGDVECLVTRAAVVAEGQEYDEEDAKPAAILCQRRSGSLTVRVRASGEPDLDDTVDFVGDVWDELD